MQYTYNAVNKKYETIFNYQYVISKIQSYIYSNINSIYCKTDIDKQKVYIVLWIATQPSFNCPLHHHL